MQAGIHALSNVKFLLFPEVVNSGTKYLFKPVDEFLRILDNETFNLDYIKSMGCLEIKINLYFCSLHNVFLNFN